MGIKPSQYFWLEDGTSVKNLYELSNSLEKMKKNSFNRYVTNDKNDFANWIRDVIKDKELAEKVRPVKTKATVIKYIKQKLQKQKKIAKKVNAKKTKVVKKMPIETKNVDFISKVKDFLFKQEEKKAPKVTFNPGKTTLGAGCPYKSYKCSLIDFLIGIIVGLIIGLFLVKLL